MPHSAVRRSIRDSVVAVQFQHVEDHQHSGRSRGRPRYRVRHQQHISAAQFIEVRSHVHGRHNQFTVDHGVRQPRESIDELRKRVAHRAARARDALNGMSCARQHSESVVL